MRFASEFDKAAFHLGPPALFTQDPRGNLRIDPERTREVWLLVPDAQRGEGATYILTDTATGVRMLLATNCPALALCQPRGSVLRVDDYDAARAEVAGQW
ncbi:MAG: hypothetical protein EXR71_07395 [Myxococcales bacterium]|nr:hypothetical protein [Myxococcales bacterium]